MMQHHLECAMLFAGGGEGKTNNKHESGMQLGYEISLYHSLCWIISYFELESDNNPNYNKVTYMLGFPLMEIKQAPEKAVNKTP